MYPASIKPDQPSLDRRRRPGELSIPARYASIQRVPTGIRAVSDPQLVGHRLAMELFENPRGGYPGGSVLGPTNGATIAPRAIAAAIGKPHILHPAVQTRRSHN